MKYVMQNLWKARKTVSLAFCLGLSQAQAGPAGTCDLVLALEFYATTNMPPKDSACDTYLGTKNRSGTSCFWEFSFRDQKATEFADALWDTVTNCRAGQRAGPDSQVNHPDSYELRELVVGHDIYRVSLKDKGHQGRTLVFFRFEQSTAKGAD